MPPFLDFICKYLGSSLKLKNPKAKRVILQGEFALDGMREVPDEVICKVDIGADPLHAAEGLRQVWGHGPKEVCPGYGRHRAGGDDIEDEEAGDLTLRQAVDRKLAEEACVERAGGRELCLERGVVEDLIGVAVD